MNRLVALWVLLIAVSPWVAGCQFGRPDHLQLATESYFSGDLLKAQDYLSEEIKKHPEGHEDQHSLNLASLYAAGGRFRQAEATFLATRNRQTIQKNQVVDFAQQGAALFSDQRSVSYSWRQYEHLLALCLIATGS